MQADNTWFCRNGRGPEQWGQAHPRDPSAGAIPRIVQSDFSADNQFDSLVVDL